MKKAYRSILKKSPDFSFSRSVTPSVYQTRALKQQFIPGVGAYQESDNAYKKYSITRARAAVIFPYNIKRFTETIMDKSKNTPGPGSYDIIPPIKRY